MRRGLPALLLTTLARAAAAEVETEFAPFLHDSDRPQVLALDGPIDGRTPVMFQRALQRFADVTVLELSSDGGNVYDALPLAYVVRRVGLRASIPPGRSCASACTYLFFAGVGRDAEGQLGVHSIAMPSNDLAAGQLALADIFAAFEDFGVPSAVHTRMMATPAESMYWFAPEEMVALGLIGQIGAVRSDAGLRASLRAQLELETAMPDWAGPPPGITPGQLAAVEQQRQLVAAAPEDAAARDVLAGYEAALGNYRVAHQHKSYVIALRGADAGVEDFATLVYYLVAAAAGQVSSEAEVALRQALQRDETNGISLYYLGLMYGQNGRPGVAFAIWRDLMARSQPTDPWVAPIQSQIETVAAAAGIDTDQPAARVALPPGVQQIVAPPPEGVPVAAVLDGPVEDALRARHRGDGAHEPLALEVLHHVVEARVLVAEEVLRRDLAVLEDELGRVGAVVAELLELLPDREALRVGREHEERDALVAVAARPHGKRDEVRARPVRDVRLRPVDHVVVADLLRRRAQVRHVGADVRLGDPERRDRLPRHRRLPEVLLVVVVADLADDRRRHVALHEEAHREAGEAAVHELLGVGGREPPVEPLPAPLLGHADPEEAELTRLLEDLVREVARLLPRVGVGGELGEAPVADRLPQHLVLRAELGVAAVAGRLRGHTQHLPARVRGCADDSQTGARRQRLARAGGGPTRAIAARPAAGRAIRREPPRRRSYPQLPHRRGDAGRSRARPRFVWP